MYERAYGEKYDANLSTTQVAALVRGQIKAAVKAGELPAGKYSVRSSSYSMGSSINIRISGLSGQVFEPEYLTNGDKYLNGPSVEDATGWHRPSRYAAPVLVAVKKVEEMLAAYNHDGSDIQSDYFDVKFYGHVSVETTVAEEQVAREALAAAASASAEVVTFTGVMLPKETKPVEAARVVAMVAETMAEEQAKATAWALSAPRRARLINSVSTGGVAPAANVLPFVAPVRDSEEPEQVRFMREAGLI